MHKPYTTIIALLIGLCIAGHAHPAMGNDADDSLAASFQNPPAEARPWVYWFWMNGNITRDAITADLQAMHDAGIGGALIMHVGAGIPAGPVRFFSDQWRDLFKFAVSEADRLGIQITMSACDGWTGTGGPWIKPEEAMMKMVWTETQVQGNRNGKPINLPQPNTNLDVYHDIAVLAFPTVAAELDKTKASRITSSDPNCNVEMLIDENNQTSALLEATNGGPWMQFEFSEPFTARGLRCAATANGKLRGTAKLQTSDDGKNYQTTSEATFGWHANQPSVTIRFDETTARFFRVVFPRARLKLAEVNLLGEARINYWEPKSGFARRRGHGNDAPMFNLRSNDTQSDEVSETELADSLIVIRDQIQNLTDRLDENGRLDWQPLEGDWTVLRIGYTPTGEKNGPASVEGTGLEPDALSGKGVEIAFERFFAKLLDDVGPLAGKTLRSLHLDSWETGEQNWTASFPDEFKKRRGYELWSWLPVMAGGRIVGDLDASERFLWDVRRTIADLLADNYYGRLREVANQNGLSFSSEAAGAQQFLFDPLVAQSQADIPMGEFWVSENLIRPDCKAAASVAHLLGKRFVAAESFTSGPPQARWTQHPDSLKPLGDEAFCHGVNRFVFHRYAMQPWKDLKPGMTMGRWGIHLDRTNTWWTSGGKAWFEYLARCQFMLQEGQFVGDVLYFTGEDIPNYLGYRHELNPPLPSSYDYDGCSAKVLLSTTVRDGRIVVPGGMSYRVLLLPDSRRMRPELLRHVQTLVEAGGKCPKSC